MVNLISLWLPIVLSAVGVFVVSSIIHMLIPYHRSDFKKLPSEDEVMGALRPFSILPGDYVMPYCGGVEGHKSKEYKEKTTKGPVAFMTVLPSGPQQMGASLVLWFLYSILVSIMAGYVAGIQNGPGAHYMTIFRFTSTVAFVGYSLALLQNSIWYKRNWAATLKSMFDGLIYAFVTAGFFGWLWPKV